MPTSMLAKEDEVGLLDIIEDTNNLFKDVNAFCNKPEVVDFITETATTVLEVALAIILFKLVVRVLFK